MKNRASILLGIFIAITLASCGTNSIVVKEGRNSVRNVLVTHDFNYGRNSTENQSIVLPNNHIFINRIISANGNEYVIERYDDTLGNVWSRVLKTPAEELQPQFFMLNGMIVSLASAAKADKRFALSAHQIDPSNGMTLQTKELFITEPGQSHIFMKQSADQSKIMAASFVKNGNQYALQCNIIDKTLNVMKEYSIPLEITGDMIEFENAAEIHGKNGENGKIFPDQLYEYYKHLMDIAVTNDGEVFLVTAYRRNGGELVVKRGSNGKNITLPIPVAETQKNFFYDTFLMKEVGSGKLMLTSRIYRESKNFALLVAQLDIPNNSVDFTQLHNISDEKIFFKDGITAMSIAWAHPIYLAPVSGNGYVIVAESFSSRRSNVSGDLTRSVELKSYGPVVIAKIDNLGDLVWAKEIDRNHYVEKGTYGDYFFVEGSTNIAQFGDKLKISFRDRNYKHEEEFMSYEVDAATGKISQYDVPVKFAGNYKGGVVFIRDLSKWTNDKTFLLIGNQSQLSNNAQIIQMQLP